jgi:maltodextrin utilization protein YvdJ
MNKKLPFFQKFKYAIIKPSAYPEMVQEGVKRAILYLLLLALTLGVISATYHTVSSAISYNAFISNLEKDIPDFALENGELTVEGDEPIIYEENTVGETFIIDDTGTYTRENIDILLAEYTTVVLITDKYILTVDGAETTEYRFSEFGDFYVDKDMLLTFLPYLTWLLVLVGIGIVFWFFVSKLIMGFLYALFGMIVASILKKKYSYGKLYSLGLYAITVPTIVAIIISMIGFSLPWVLYLAIVIVYYVLALRSVPVEENKQPENLIEE